jgi:enterobacteria phage integrase
MAVLGHKTLSEAERYMRQADQARLAIEAMTKLEGRTANAQTASDGLGNASKTEEKSK